jgi:hypothetical protein
MSGDRPLRLLQLTDSHLRAAPDGTLKGCRTRDTLNRRWTPRWTVSRCPTAYSPPATSRRTAAANLMRM